MTVFVDTSALYPLIDRADPDHRLASAIFRELVASDALVTHNYVVVEAVSLVHRRLGRGAARALIEAVLPVLRVIWVSEDLHAAAIAMLLGRGPRDVSLVDRVSFEVMSGARIDRAFAFDRHFRDQGFATVP